MVVYVTKNSGPENVVIGQLEAITFQINSVNAGPGEAVDAVVTNVIPYPMVWNKTTTFHDQPINCTTLSNIVRCVISRLVVGDLAVIRVEVDVPSNATEQTIYNYAMIGGNGDDSSNNAVNVSVVLRREADLEVKIGGPFEQFVDAGSFITRRILYSNLGASDAEEVVVEWLITSPLEYVSVDDGRCEYNQPVVVCKLGNVTAGVGGVIEVVEWLPSYALFPEGGSITSSVNITR